jgi:hypothetical protein
MDEKKIVITANDFKLIIDKKKNESNEIPAREPSLKLLYDKLSELETEEKK